MYSLLKYLEKYFRQHNDLELDNVIKYFEGKYTKHEISNALKTIIENNVDIKQQ